MSKSGPVVLVEDDNDDREIFREVFSELRMPNELVCFDNCRDAFTYLKSSGRQPFLIFSDINLPGEGGLEFKKSIDDDKELRKKSIPFVFYSTSVDPHTVNRAYTEMTVQGYFKKEVNYTEIINKIRIIMDYWSSCRHPNSE